VTDPLEAMSRAELARLGREYLLAGHMIDRAGMPYVVKELGLDAMRDVAIEEWMSASPVYTRRVRRALGFEGDDVATIFKGMQFDIGAPHQFMDFRFTVHDAAHGEFSLASCGALMDVEPMGEPFVVTMCHHIEDPTFDATASATNPRARMRPVHRPPRMPADRLPHCNWLVEIDPNAEPLNEPEGARWLATSKAAHTDLRTPPADDHDDGDTTYDGWDPDISFERFSRATLLRLLDEIALQGHLLARAYMRAVERRSDAATAARLGAHQFTGAAGLVAKRLARFLGTGSGVDAIADVLAIHPAFRPRAYVSSQVSTSDGALTFALERCDALDEGDRLTWPAIAANEGGSAIAAIVHAVDPDARVEQDSGAPVWRITEGTEQAPVAEEVTVASFSTGADYTFASAKLDR